MWPSEILDELRAERGRVGEVFAEVRRTLDRGSSSHELRERLLGLRYAVLDYTGIEDELLPEVMRTLEVWGTEQMDAIGRAHAELRGVVARALAMMDDLSLDAMPDDPRALKLVLARLYDELSAALAREDAVLRNATDRDDVKRFDGFGG